MQLNDGPRHRSFGKEVCVPLATNPFQQIWRCLRDEWRGNGTFLGKGHFTELMLSISELMIGIHILIAPGDSLNSSVLLDKMEDSYPIRAAGVFWLLSGTLTLIGILLFALGYRTTGGYKIERLLRFLGALGSTFIWLAAGLTLWPSPFAYIYYMASIASMRTARIVWHK